MRRDLKTRKVGGKGGKDSAGPPRARTERKENLVREITPKHQKSLGEEKGQTYGDTRGYASLRVFGQPGQRTGGEKRAGPAF